jgi:hypothetical protein
MTTLVVLRCTLSVKCNTATLQRALTTRKRGSQCAHGVCFVFHHYLHTSSTGQWSEGCRSEHKSVQQLITCDEMFAVFDVTQASAGTHLPCWPPK